jgi:hypothetical protein
MVVEYADPFETLFAFQRALENRLSSDWLGTTTAATGAYPPVNAFQQGHLRERRCPHRRLGDAGRKQ